MLERLVYAQEAVYLQSLHKKTIFRNMSKLKKELIILLASLITLTLFML